MIRSGPPKSPTCSGLSAITVPWDTLLTSVVLYIVIPVLLAREYGFDDVLLSAIGLAAFLGHLYPVFFRFEGGKGVATALGVLLAAATGRMIR